MIQLKKLSAIALSLLIACMVFWSIDLSTAQADQIRNASFETGTFQEWLYGEIPGPGLVTPPLISSAHVHSGAYSVDIETLDYIEQYSLYGHGIVASGALAFWSFNSLGGPWEGKCRYLCITVVYADGSIDGGLFNGYADVIQDQGDGWYQYSFAVSLTKSIVKIRFDCTAGEMLSHTIFIDDISLEGTLSRIWLGLRPIFSIRKWIPTGQSADLPTEFTNMETYPESFNYTMYASMQSNVTLIGAQTVSNLNPNETATLTWLWNTTGFAMGDYIISFYMNGGNFTNYNCLNVTAGVTITGDINGDFQVALNDLVLLASAYGSTPAYLRWNPNADINPNGIIDLVDLVLLATHYGQHYP